MGLKDNLKETARKLLAEQEQKIARAYQGTPAKYHQFISILDQNKALANVEVELDAEMRQLGMFVFNGKTFVHLKNPYMTVDGRIKMFNDAHQKEGETCYKITVTSNIDDIVKIIETTGSRPPADYPMVVRVESELFGRLEGVSRIFWDGKDASKTNPLEVAYTSALGRAIAQVGFGLIGTGVASAEEVINAANAEEADAQLEKPQTRQEASQPLQQEQKTGTFKVEKTQKIAAQGNPVLKVVLVDTQTGEKLEALAVGDQMAIESAVGVVKATLAKRGVYYVLRQYEEEEDPFGLLDEIA